MNTRAAVFKEGVIVEMISFWRRTEVTLALGYALPTALVAGLLARSAPDEIVLFLSVTMMFFTTWGFSSIRSAQVMTNDYYMGTIAFDMLANVPVGFALLGKVTGVVLIGAVSGCVAFAGVLLVSGSDSANALRALGVLALTFPFALAAIVALCSTFAPLGLLLGRRPGWQIAITPIGTALSGFVIPPSRFIEPLNVLPFVLSTGWLSQGVWDLASTPSVGDYLVFMAGSLLVAAVWVAASMFFLGRVETRVRISGEIL
ncbi:MAG: hypothetical protein OXH12_06590 [Chloroflexi bacterium]|nr:hypothetical protein [Chloroflexota bacterium]